MVHQKPELHGDSVNACLKWNPHDKPDRSSPASENPQSGPDNDLFTVFAYLNHVENLLEGGSAG